jgi:hypothetical protein
VTTHTTARETTIAATATVTSSTSAILQRGSERTVGPELPTARISPVSTIVDRKLRVDDPDIGVE